VVTLVGSGHDSAPVPGALWAVTAVWLGLEGLLLSARSRVAALAGETAAGLWILLISVPAAGRTAVTATVGATAAASLVWALGTGRTLRGVTGSSR
jgi:hypothetical protein